MLMSIIIAIPIGVITAVRKDSIIDIIGKIFAVLGQSMPLFLLGIVLIMVFSVKLGWFPAAGNTSLKHYILPSITLGWYVVAGIMRLTRSAMLDTLGEEYIKLARIKGSQKIR